MSKATSPAILIQGMRRSGTTILYDALLEDPGLHCFYEPWREDTAVGAYSVNDRGCATGKPS